MGVTWTDILDIFQMLGTWVIAVAAVVGILYAGRIRKEQRENKAYLSVTLEAEVGERCDGSAWILVSAVLHNPSKILCVPERYRWKIWDVSKGDEARLLEDESCPMPKGSIELEPGEVYPIPFFDRVVPKDLKVLRVYFGIPYDDSQGLEWGKTTLIGRRQ